MHTIISGWYRPEAYSNKGVEVGIRQITHVTHRLDFYIRATKTNDSTEYNFEHSITLAPNQQEVVYKLKDNQITHVEYPQNEGIDLRCRIMYKNNAFYFILPLTGPCFS